MTVWFFLLLPMIPVLHVHTECPSTLLDVGDDQCMIHFPGKYTYCEAHELCQRSGQDRKLRLFMVGQHAMKIRDRFKLSAQIFTGLHTLLVDVGTMNSGWQLSDPGSSTGIADGVELHWSFGKPISGYERIVLVSKYGLIDTEHRQIMNAVTCELSRVPSPLKSSVQLFVKNKPRNGLFFKTTSSKGCFSDSTQETLVKCAFRCRNDEVCRSVYYNKGTKTCFLSRFVDSRLPGKSWEKEADYVRLLRMNW
ncbi:hypothetical protein CRM22_001245 [Opisthorchis felineus]|uniref:Apple domain-containing protein n=1 Tax=Opisthorchis felineus TaxID=147828 RepID=A0A4S2MBG1_OPIFE|nr:hypothetical protein CRM22_001245 [Opisthorchis felineus]